MAYSPLGRGFLTGEYKSQDDFEKGDRRRYFPRFSTENFSENLLLVDHFAVISRRKCCTNDKLTLAWLVAQGDDIFPIP